MIRRCEICGHGYGSPDPKQLLSNLLSHVGGELKRAAPDSPDYRKISGYYETLEQEYLDLEKQKPVLARLAVTAIVLLLVFGAILPAHAAPGGPLTVTLTTPTLCTNTGLACVVTATASGGNPGPNGYMITVTYSNNAFPTQTPVCTANNVGGGTAGLCGAQVWNETVQFFFGNGPAGCSGQSGPNCGPTQYNPTITATVQDLPSSLGTTSTNTVSVSSAPIALSSTSCPNNQVGTCPIPTITVTNSAGGGGWTGSIMSGLTASIYPGLPIPTWLVIVGAVGLVTVSSVSVHSRRAARA
jgi:hypothetical protein